MITRLITHHKIVSGSTIQKLEDELNEVFDEGWEPYDEDMFYINNYNLKLVIYDNPRYKIFKCKIIHNNDFLDLIDIRHSVKSEGYKFPFCSVNIKGEYIQVGYMLEPVNLN